MEWRLKTTVGESKAKLSVAFLMLLIHLQLKKGQKEEGRIPCQQTCHYVEKLRRIPTALELVGLMGFQKMVRFLNLDLRAGNN